MNKRLLLAGSVKILARNKMRSLFMSLGIVVGVAALVMMRSMGTSAEASMSDKIQRMFSATGIIITNSSSGSGSGGPQELGKLTIEDIEAIADQLEQVVDWDPRLVISRREVQYRGHTRSLMIVGHSERSESVWQRGVELGEFFSRADVRSAARVALIGSRTAEALFGGEDPVGKQIRIGSSPFRVKGVLEEIGFDPHGNDRDDEVHVPITTIMRRLLNLDRIGLAKVIVSSPEEVEETSERIAEILVARHGLADDEADDFSIYTPTQAQQAVKEVNRVLTVYLPATAGIALLVAGIVIANMMLIGVRERIAEIGLRKALGATDRQISGQFLLESLAMAAISGALGAVLGAGIIVAAARTTSQEIRVTPDAILLGFTAALVVGMVAGYLPARRAALQEPVDALR